MFLSTALRRMVKIAGDKPAVVCDGTGLTWTELLDRVSRLGAALNGLGVQPNDRVALLIANSNELFSLFQAVPWIGAIIVPINIRYSPEEITDVLQDCGAKILLVDGAFEVLGVAVASPLGIPVVSVAPGGAVASDVPSINELKRTLPPALAAGRTDSDILALFYTGGTSGRSKGVMLTIGNLQSNVMANLAEGLYGSRETHLHTAPSFHIGGASGVFSVMVSGARSVMLPRFDAGAVLNAIAAEKCTSTLLVPTMLQMVLDHPAFEQTDTSSLRQVLYGASPISEALLDRALARWPAVRFTQLYGMTELSPVCTVLHAEEHVGVARVKNRHRSAGRATFGLEVEIVNPEGMPVARGEIGEIVVRGPNVMAGYWDRPEETSKAIRGGWMHTGDGGYMDDEGFVFVVDRLKDMIISGGENVYSIEVENVLARHPAVLQCAVIGVPDAHWGERVHAVVVLRPDCTLSEKDLGPWCRQYLAGFKIPRSFEIGVKPLPMTSAGKILKRELRAPHWQNQERKI